MKSKTVVNLHLPANLLKEIEDYRFEQRITSRTQAIILLIVRGLKQKPKREP